MADDCGIACGPCCSHHWQSNDSLYCALHAPVSDYEDLKKNHCLPQRRQHLRSKGGKAEDQVTWQSSCQQNERIPGGKRPETARNPTEPLSDRTTTEPGKPPTHWRYSRWRQHRGYRFSWNEVVEMVRPLRKVKFGGLLMAGMPTDFMCRPNKVGQPKEGDIDITCRNAIQEASKNVSWPNLVAVVPIEHPVSG
ncbi:uncharacterized protein BO96DRAFT_345988 [Aspergillus niger CBS 101883]|uniref:Uncharacterized protein n=2 Tax=Aspergillus niger TaxID=5061 RepID=A2QHU1_ASPNC|nr:uncharacterized protein BO96DRAFT_345988 [Aspergillus niger CBS 101883]XP_059600469.1 hypothetical protein An04g01040 [Aspergillus niger]PYH53088.1 hypothetical protein BO96DRAFT_345988 [Aspergillus niger CBS 101883]CAK38561.1 hypothetical protein An04g01040 [Aspergillus niger]